MLNLDEAGIKRYARIWGGIFILRGLIEFGFFMLGSVSAGEPPIFPPTIPYLAAGIVALYFPTAVAFLYYAVVWGLGGVSIAISQGAIGFLPIFDLFFAGILAFIYWQLNQQEASFGHEPDELFVDLFPKIAIGAGVLGLLLAPLAAFAETAPVLAAPGVQFGIFAAAAGAASLGETRDQFPLSAGGVLLGVVAIILWAILGVL